MATSKVRRSVRSRKNKLDLAQYARLRTILDSLELGALRYYLDTQNRAERNERFKTIESAVMPVIREMWGSGQAQAECPEGYMNCGGVCVPYQCFGGDY